MLFQRFGNSLGNIRRLVETVRNLLAANFADQIIDALRVLLHSRVKTFLPARNGHRAGVGLQRTVQQTQQCGFACAVQSDHGHPPLADGDVRGSKSHVPIIIRMPGLFQSERQRCRVWQFFRSKQESHAAIVRGVQVWCRQTPAYRSKAATVLSTARMPRSNSSGSGSRETARYPLEVMSKK